MCVSSYSRRCACHLECCLQSSWTVDHQHPICMHTGHTAARAVARWTSRHGSRSASNRLYFVTRLQGAPAARGPALRHSQHNKPRAHSLATAAATGPAMATAGAAPEQIASNKCCGGYNKRFKHTSSSLGCDMNFTIFFPAGTEDSSSQNKFPILYYLSGLTCTDENVIQKAGAQKACAKHGIAFVAPDTSPRGLNVEGEADSWDFGVGAGFYINATEDKWKNWRTYDYITKELPALVAAHFPQLDTSNASITGHSMGGHGALTIALKNPGVYKSLSAFAPICNPCNVPWGTKAFTGYFGEANKDLWKAHDATELVKTYSGPALPTLIDTGTADNFLERELKPEAFEAAAKAAGFPVTMRMQEGYDHSYFFMATFMEEHVDFHAKYLKA